MSLLTDAYARLPYPAKVVAATARGAQLRRWRYGPDAEALVELSLEADTISPEAWRELTEDRCARYLHRAAAMVPHHREHWAARRRAGDRRSVEDLANWPVLTKAEVKADPWAFVADDSRGGPLFTEHTSGTTGTPLTLWWSTAATRCWYALFEARTRRWHGVSRHEPWAILGGQPVVAADRHRPPYWVWNPAMSQLYLSSYHLGPASVADYVDALEAHGVTHLVGYPSALASLARLVSGAGLEPPAGLRVALTNAESLLDRQRATVERGLHVPVRDMFGQAEIVAAASECGHGTLHQWPEAGIVEVLDDHHDTATGGTGRLVATGLLNDAMALIRYDTGDRLAPAEAGGPPCACGRTLPAFGRVEGRRDDVVLTPDGREVGRLDPVFKADFPIAEAQIVQRSRSELLVRVVPLDGFGARTRAEIVDRLRERVGDLQVTVTEVDRIERTANGKFRAVISELVDDRVDDRDGLR